MRTALLGLTIILAFVAKAWALDDALVGAWQHEHGTIDFYADGTFLAGDGRTLVKGAWQAEDGRITVTITPPGSSTAQSVTCDYKVEGDKAAITGGEGCSTLSMDRIVAVKPADPERPILGTWDYDLGWIEFLADGTLTGNGHQGRLSGTWTVQNGQITVSLAYSGSSTYTMTCDFTIGHNTMTITGGETQQCGRTIFRRVS